MQIATEVAALALEYFPEPHRTQVAELGKPIEEEYVPEAQVAQAVPPVAEANVPAWQRVHVLTPAMEYDPDEQFAQVRGWEVPVPQLGP